MITYSPCNPCNLCSNFNLHMPMHYTTKISTLGYKYPLTACVQTLLVVHTSHTVVHNPVTIPYALSLPNTHPGVWSSPLLKGEIPPPCSHFSFTKVDQDRVVLFGGWQSDRVVNDHYLFNLRNMVSWCGVL